MWILAGIMAFAFFGLLFLQFKYLRNSIDLRSEHFDQAVNRSLVEVAHGLEIEQTRKYLVEGLRKETTYKKSPALNNPIQNQLTTQQRIKIEADESGFNIEYSESRTPVKEPSQVFQSPSKRGTNAISKTISDLQSEEMRRYIYEIYNMNEVINMILNTSSDTPISERIDMKMLETRIKHALKSNEVELAFQYEVVNKNDIPIYPANPQSMFAQYDNSKEVYSKSLFPNDPQDKVAYLKVYFPEKSQYLLREVSFMYPSIGFTIILLVTFIIMLYITFQQKRLSEMKNDFMNNMTHELKTPVSTISLAAQMLKDGAISKSPEVFKHISGVINDETERLSFQVEKVLQMSLFEKQKATLKLKELDVNDVVVHVANTFQLKVEKFGGNLDIDLQATESAIEADKMHFTNVLFNLLDNAVKYRKEDVPLELMIRTWNSGNNKLYVSVEDNGIGIKKELVKKVFDRFYRVSTGNRHDVKGFGLGLAYVKKIVEDHKGTIKAESNLGKGTKFIICLPLMKASEKLN